MLLYGLIAIIIVQFFLSFFIIRNLLIQTERLDDKIMDTKRKIILKINETLQKMKAIDNRGAFEKDDEVGVSFKTLQSLLDDLTNEISGIQ